MKIKSIPENPTITLSTLNELIKIYEELASNIAKTFFMEDKNLIDSVYDLGRATTFELFLQLLGVQFYDNGDQA